MSESIPPPPTDLREWRTRLAYIVDMMRDMSRMTEPQSMVQSYRDRVAKLLPSDRFIALSRRDLPAPKYKITRTNLWKEEVNPWEEPEKLPVFEGGLLGKLLYSDEPHVIEDLTVSPDDPAYEFLKGHRSLIAMPTYDHGVAMNMTVLMRTVPNGFNVEQFPEVVWQSNLFGRFTNNLMLAEQLRKAYAVVDRELKAVAAIQRSLLPPEVPRVKGMDVATFYQTSKDAGGDYYDFFPLPDGRWGIFVADVSGHGTPAAVVMAVTHTIAHLFPTPHIPTNQVLEFINRKIFEPYTSSSGTFVTAFYGVYDPKNRKLVYSSAGHNPPRLRRRATAEITAIDDAQSLPLGINPAETFIEKSQQLEPGDQIVFYTDGITEARNGTGKMWGVEGLDEAILARECGAQELLKGVLDALAGFMAGAVAVDDQTLVMVQVE